MNFPKHTNPNQKRAATAPYNFVPLPDEIVEAATQSAHMSHNIYRKDLFTGKIHCRLETKTPLYSRAALEPDESAKRLESKDKTDFFYVDPDTKKPVLPGSSLRGMLRTMIEIITFSKPQPVINRQLFFRTLDDSAIGTAYSKRMVAGNRNSDGSYPNVFAGYMELVGGEFFIRPAQWIHKTQFYRIEEDLAVSLNFLKFGAEPLKNMSAKDNGRWRPNRTYRWGRIPIWFVPTKPQSHKPASAQYYAEVSEVRLRETNNPPGNEWVQGWFVASGWVPGPKSSRGKRLHWIIGPEQATNSRIQIKDIDIEAYAELGGGISQDIQKRNMSVLPKKANDLVPCFYSKWKDREGNERIAFGHTAMFRLPYEYSPQDLLPYTQEQAKLTDFAESLFGWVDDKKGRIIASRISVSDAHIADDFAGDAFSPADEDPITVLLSGPKPTSFQHYLTQGSDKKKELYHYQDRKNTTLRGHKLYWHKNGNLQKSDYHTPPTAMNQKQVTSIQPVKAGVPFEYKIHFQNLAAEELGSLLWVLTVAGDSKHCLKLGMGKPLGLGSVQIHSTLCLTGRRKRYQSLFGNGTWDSSATTSVEAQPKTLSALQNLLFSEECTIISNWNLFTDAFEEYMLSRVNNRGTSFSQLQRVQMLLVLLQYPGPNNEDIRYMQGPNNEHKQNEFKERPVLPDPLWVVGLTSQTEQNNQSNKRTPERMSEPERTTNTAIASEVFDFLVSSTPDPLSTTLPQDLEPKHEATSLDELQENDLLTGRVIRVERDSVVVDIGIGEARLHANQVFPTVNNLEKLEQEFYTDRTIKVWVKGRNSRGKVQLTMRQPKK